MISLSTGLRMAVAGNYGAGSMMNGGVIRIYGGTRPFTPDSTPGATEIGRITTEGRVWHPDTDPNDAGLVVQVVYPGALVNAGEWRLVGSAAGMATWFRWCWAASDPQHDSTYYPRIDGDIGIAPEEGEDAPDLVLISTSITANTDWLIDNFFFVLPMGGA